MAESLIGGSRRDDALSTHHDSHPPRRALFPRATLDALRGREANRCDGWPQGRKGYLLTIGP